MKNKSLYKSLFPHIIDFLEKTHEFESVMLTGSLMEGIGNLNSDIDIYVITTSRDSSIVQILENQIIQHTTFDFIFLNKCHLLDIFSKLENEPSNLDIYDIELIHRLKYAEEIYDLNKNEEYKRAICFNSFNVAVAEKYFEKSLKYVENSNGALKVQDYGTSYFLLKKGLEETMLSYLALYGETNPNGKWIYKKLMKFQKDTGDKKTVEKFLFLISEPFDKGITRFVPDSYQFIYYLQNIIIQKINFDQE